MIRCWGGNVYEHDRFFDLAAMRRASWSGRTSRWPAPSIPRTRSSSRSSRTEVRQVVRRLRQHACLAIWAGDNECDETVRLEGRGDATPTSNVLTRGVIPAVLRDGGPVAALPAELALRRRVAYAVGERSLPEDHLWGPRDYYKSPFYRDAVAHFASEIGYHGCPDVASLRRFLSPGKLWPYARRPGVAASCHVAASRASTPMTTGWS